LAGAAVLCISLLVVAHSAQVGGTPIRVAAVGAAVAVAAVGAARVLLGAHYLTDVLAGALLGAACALGATALLVDGRHSLPGPTYP